MIEYFKISEPFYTEQGDVIPELWLTYSTYGTLNKKRDNIIWVCHAFSADSNVAEWWSGLFGEGKILDPQQHFIKCVNVPGSCYGSTGPLTFAPHLGKPWYHDFPLLSIRDVVNAYESLFNHLKINKIALLLGGSLGGQQALEFAFNLKNKVEKLALIASNAYHSPWAIAFNEAQRLSIFADGTYSTNSPIAGTAGMKAARAVAQATCVALHVDEHGRDVQRLVLPGPGDGHLGPGA